MPDFSRRSRAVEMLDQEQLDPEELFQNLKELDTINRLLGGHHASIKGLSQLIRDPKKEYHIVDFACGGGDSLRAIADWGKSKSYRLRLSGFDLLPEAIEFAREQSVGYDIHFEQADFANFEANTPVDISICSLVCHHFYDEKLLHFLRKMKQIARLGVVINDLHRHSFAYFSIKGLTQLLSKSTYVKHDAPLSVLKGFQKGEWQKILKEVGYEKYRLEWIWAFRHLIVEENAYEKV